MKYFIEVRAVNDRKTILDRVCVTFPDGEDTPSYTYRFRNRMDWNLAKGQSPDYIVYGYDNQDALIRNLFHIHYYDEMGFVCPMVEGQDYAKVEQ